jgi:hypothetical protein
MENHSKKYQYTDQFNFSQIDTIYCPKLDLSDYVVGGRTATEIIGKGLKKGKLTGNYIDHYSGTYFKNNDCQVLIDFLNVGNEIQRLKKENTIQSYVHLLIPLCKKYGLLKWDKQPIKFTNIYDENDFVVDIQSFQNDDGFIMDGKMALDRIDLIFEQFMAGEGNHQGPDDLFKSLSLKCGIYMDKDEIRKFFFYVDSVIDLAIFQCLQTLDGSRGYRKCENPNCFQLIKPGSRSSKRTCSPACKKALQRQRKKEACKHGEH